MVSSTLLADATLQIAWAASTRSCGDASCTIDFYGGGDLKKMKKKLLILIRRKYTYGNNTCGRRIRACIGTDGIRSHYTVVYTRNEPHRVYFIREKFFEKNVSVIAQVSDFSIQDVR